MKFSEFKKNIDSGVKTSLDTEITSEKTKNLRSNIKHTKQYQSLADS
jgi:hypothetical protein